MAATDGGDRQVRDENGVEPTDHVIRRNTNIEAKRMVRTVLPSHRLAPRDLGSAPTTTGKENHVGILFSTGLINSLSQERKFNDLPRMMAFRRKRTKGTSA